MEPKPGWSHDEQTLETAAQYVAAAADLAALRAVSPRVRHAVAHVAQARYPRHARLAAARGDSPSPSWEALCRCATHGAARALGELSRSLWETRGAAARTAAQGALRAAARADDAAAIARLVDAGVHLELDAEHAMPVLHAAAMDGRARALAELLASGADALRTHADGSLPANLAAHYGRRACVALLMREARVCLDARDGFGSTPLHAAVLMGEREIVEDLLALGADTRLRSNSGRDALALAQRRENSVLIALIARHRARRPASPGAAEPTDRLARSGAPV